MDDSASNESIVSNSITNDSEHPLFQGLNMLHGCTHDMESADKRSWSPVIPTQLTTVPLLTTQMTDVLFSDDESSYSQSLLIPSFENDRYTYSTKDELTPYCSNKGSAVTHQQNNYYPQAEENLTTTKADYFVTDDASSVNKFACAVSQNEQSFTDSDVTRLESDTELSPNFDEETDKDISTLSTNPFGRKNCFSKSFVNDVFQNGQKMADSDVTRLDITQNLECVMDSDVTRLDGSQNVTDSQVTRLVTEISPETFQRETFKPAVCQHLTDTQDMKHQNTPDLESSLKDCSESLLNTQDFQLSQVSNVSFQSTDFLLSQPANQNMTDTKSCDKHKLYRERSLDEENIFNTGNKPVKNRQTAAKTSSSFVPPFKKIKLTDTQLQVRETETTQCDDAAEENQVRQDSKSNDSVLDRNVCCDDSKSEHTAHVESYNNHQSVDSRSLNRTALFLNTKDKLICNSNSSTRDYCPNSISVLKNNICIQGETDYISDDNSKDRCHPVDNSRLIQGYNNSVLQKDSVCVSSKTDRISSENCDTVTNTALKSTLNNVDLSQISTLSSKSLFSSSLLSNTQTSRHSGHEVVKTGEKHSSHSEVINSAELDKIQNKVEAVHPSQENPYQHNPTQFNNPLQDNHSQDYLILDDPSQDSRTQCDSDLRKLSDKPANAVLFSPVGNRSCKSLTEGSERVKKLSTNNTTRTSSDSPLDTQSSGGISQNLHECDKKKPQRMRSLLSSNKKTQQFKEYFTTKSILTKSDTRNTLHSKTEAGVTSQDTIDENGSQTQKKQKEENMLAMLTEQYDKIEHHLERSRLDKKIIYGFTQKVKELQKEITKLSESHKEERSEMMRTVGRCSLSKSEKAEIKVRMQNLARRQNQLVDVVKKHKEITSRLKSLCLSEYQKPAGKHSHGKNSNNSNSAEPNYISDVNNSNSQIHRFSEENIKILCNAKNKAGPEEISVKQNKMITEEFGKNKNVKCRNQELTENSSKTLVFNLYKDMSSDSLKSRASCLHKSSQIINTEVIEARSEGMKHGKEMFDHTDEGRVQNSLEIRKEKCVDRVGGQNLVKLSGEDVLNKQTCPLTCSPGDKLLQTEQNTETICRQSENQNIITEITDDSYLNKHHSTSCLHTDSQTMKNKTLQSFPPNKQSALFSNIKSGNSESSSVKIMSMKQQDETYYRTKSGNEKNIPPVSETKFITDKREYSQDLDIQNDKNDKYSDADNQQVVIVKNDFRDEHSTQTHCFRSETQRNIVTSSHQSGPQQNRERKNSFPLHLKRTKIVDKHGKVVDVFIVEDDQDDILDSSDKLTGQKIVLESQTKNNEQTLPIFCSSKSLFHTKGTTVNNDSDMNVESVSCSRNETLNVREIISNNCHSKVNVSCSIEELFDVGEITTATKTGKKQEMDSVSKQIQLSPEVHQVPQFKSPQIPTRSCDASTVTSPCSTAVSSDVFPVSCTELVHRMRARTTHPFQIQNIKINKVTPLVPLKKPVTQTVNSACLKDLVLAGLVKPGQSVLSVMTKEGEFRADVTLKGLIRGAEGRIFRTPCAWISAVTGVVKKKSSVYQQIHYLNKSLAELVKELELINKNKMASKCLTAKPSEQVISRKSDTCEHSRSVQSASAKCKQASSSEEKISTSLLHRLHSVRLIDDAEIVHCPELTPSFWTSDFKNFKMSASFWESVDYWT